MVLLRKKEVGGEMTNEKRRILVADDDESILEVIKIMLEGESYEVITANNGREAVDQMDDSFDLVILDVMMPECSGITACSEIRKKSMVPILFLTAKSTDADKIAGFTAGGDDYLVKPFSYAELLSRVKALIRRYHAYNQKAAGGDAEENHVIRIKDLVIDKDKSSVYVKGKEVLFTDTEYQILCLLAENRKKVFSVQTIYETVWKETYYIASNNTVTVHIRNIRKKIEEDVQKPEYIKTVWGRGYRIE